MASVSQSVSQFSCPIKLKYFVAYLFKPSSGDASVQIGECV
jgi:hypothetical protein